MLRRPFDFLRTHVLPGWAERTTILLVMQTEDNRIGDHICYISDLTKMKSHYPKWTITRNLQTTFEEIYLSWIKRENFKNKAAEFAA